MTLLMVKAWRTALEVKSFRVKIIISGILLVFCTFTAPVLFQFIQQKDGPVLQDYLLLYLPVFDLSVWIFLLLYFLILLGVLSLLSNPHRFLLALQAYIILTILRFITILLVPLNPPIHIIELNDPFVQHFFYKQTVTKDLFFSGHTSFLVLMALTVPSTRLQIVFFAGALIVALMLLLQHVHYTIDILLAPLFSWLAIALAKKVP